MNQTKLRHGVPNAMPVEASADFIAEELQRYDEYRDVRGLVADSRRNGLRVVGRLLRQQFKGCAVDIGKRRPDNIRQFFSSQLEAHRSPSKASQLASSLRSYFRYRSTCGDRAGGS